MIRRQFLELMGFVLALPQACGAAFAHSSKLAAPEFSTAYFEGVVGRSCPDLDSSALRGATAVRPFDW